MMYAWLKSVHVAAALVFVGGVLLVSVFLSAAAAGSTAVAATATGMPLTASQRVRRWDRAVTTPAMLLVWVFGLLLAQQGQWYQAGWLQAKLVAVLVLSGVHGMQSGALRRLASGNPAMGHVSARFPRITVALAIGIAVLVVAKPF
ncbi:MAG: CopD family protein [Phycisphaerae bacterium]|nr:CopD family protein [Gemmatimonadaceae bacterium]